MIRISSGLMSQLAYMQISTTTIETQDNHEIMCIHYMYLLIIPVKILELFDRFLSVPLVCKENENMKSILIAI